MKLVVRSESLYKPLENVQNIEAKVKYKDSETVAITIEATMYAEMNPTFAFACSNPFDDFSVCFLISDSMVICGEAKIKLEDGIELNAKTVQLNRPIKPGFPFVFEVSRVNNSYLQNTNILILIDTSKRIFKSVKVERS